MNLNRSKAEVEFDYDVKGMDAKTKAIMDKTMKPEFDGMKKEFKDMMLNGMPKMHNMKIITLEWDTGTVLLSHFPQKVGQKNRPRVPHSGYSL